MAAVGLRMATCGVHLGVQNDFVPPRRHIRHSWWNLIQTLTIRLRDAGFPCEDDKPLKGFHRTYVYDPFGNRIELMEVVVR